MTTPRKAPQDHKAARDPKMFYWTSASGIEFKVPKLDSLETGFIRRTRKLEPLDQMFTIAEETLTADELTALDALPLTETNRLFREWQGDAGVDVPQY